MSIEQQPSVDRLWKGLTPSEAANLVIARTPSGPSVRAKLVAFLNAIRKLRMG